MALRGVYNLPFNLDDPVHPGNIWIKSNVIGNEEKQGGELKKLVFLREEAVKVA